MSPRKILVVEDEPDLREILTTFLKRRGHSVIQATTGAEGLQLMSADQPDLLLIDKRLPDCLGYELIRNAKEGHGAVNTSTVLMTGDFVSDMPARDAPDIVLPKPFALEDLGRVIDGLLNSPRRGG